MNNVKHISAHRWFQKSYGNTYNTVLLYLDNGNTVLLPFAYGYGDYCLQRAEEWIKANCQYPNPDNLHGTRFIREVVGATYEVIDVERKKDLHKV
jgi:hypothetical protein